MNPEAAPAGIACPACGNMHRPSSWGRASLCAVCARPLGDRVRRRGRTSIVVRAVTWTTLAAVGIGSGVLVDRLFGRAAQGVVGNPATLAAPPVTLPADLRTRIEARLAVVLEDLAVDPRHPLLLQRAADLYLMKAALERESPTSPDRAALIQSRKMVDRLAEVDAPSAQQLSLKLDAFDRLRWTSEPPGLLRPTPVPSGAGRTMAPGYAPFAPASISVGNRPGSNPPGRGDEGFAGSNTPQIPPSGIGIPRPESPDLLVTGDRRGEPAPAPDRLHSDLERSDQEIAAARRDWLAAPGLLASTRTLAVALEGRAELERNLDGNEEEREEAHGRWLRAAARVYEEGAAVAPLRIQRATLWDLAADVYSRLRDREAQYRCLRHAVKEAPTAQNLWRRMQEACLATGRREEYLQARRQTHRWRLPGLTLD